ncbi:hypothetical protein EJ03DRAFT_372151 [Teratosphaeria nubilosa]|uniref:MYND-type zinc finger protein samB n=1 Tax=Teratosphaeria nubilosa TaxID=161662 RepID=A0A6G1LHQ0_9PEZI|nr:hypothetical protein EJ03DRAFT_372151 [Teratosphaeria nubilosa]
MAATANGSCATCCKAASAYCPACVEEMDGRRTPTTYYCSRACQVVDRSMHKVPCKHKKIMHRAAEVLQATFYAFREAAFDLDINSVTKNGNVLEVHHREVDAAGAMTRSPLSRFPDKLLANGDDKKAILAHAACTDATAYLHELRVKLLRGITPIIKTVDEGHICVDRRHERIRRFLDLLDGTSKLDTGVSFHEVIILSCTYGSKFVFYPAGAQYGQYSPLLRLDDYLKDWAAPGKTLQLKPHGSMHLYLQEATAGGHQDVFTDTHDLRSLVIHDEVVQAMNYAVADWEKKNGKSVHKILTQKQAAYEADRNSLVQAMRKGMCAYIQWWEARPDKFETKRIPREPVEAKKPKLTLERTPISETEQAQAEVDRTLASLRLLENAEDSERKIRARAGSEKEREYASQMEAFLKKEEVKGPTILRM